MATDLGPERSTEPLTDRDDVRAWLAANVYGPRPKDPQRGAVGLEAELLPFWVTREGRPAARLALVEIVAIVDALAEARRRPDAGGRPSWLLGDVLITEEPGAQVELAGPPEPDADRAIRGLEAAIELVAGAFARHGAGLAACGLDLWSDRDRIPVQLDVPRYRAMSGYFAKRGGPAGHLLMCASCSLQVNVDLGPPEVAARRWLVANLAAPVFTAAFAASPLGDDVNARSLGWRALDPTRTGVAPPLVAGIDDPLEHVLADALRADVLLVQRGDEASCGEPGWSFGDWIARGHPRFGPPTVADLETHLSTLFPEARLRGYLEVRTLDITPAPWRGATVALVVGLLYDDAAREVALDTLAGWRADLPHHIEVAAHRGLRDPQVRRVTEVVLTAAVEGARRLGIEHAEVAASFVERFVVAGRHPADELRAALRRSDAEGFAWARV